MNNIILKFDKMCVAFFGCGDRRDFHCDKSCCFHLLLVNLDFITSNDDL